MKENQFDVPTDRENHFVRVSVDYYKGRRGLYVYVTPVEVRGNMVSMRLLSGCTLLWEPMARKNRRRIDQVYAQVEGQLLARSGRAWDAVAKVAEVEKITLAPKESSVA